MFAQVETAFRPRWRVKTILEHTSIAARIYRSFSPNGNGFFGAEPSPGQDGSAGYFAGKRRMRSTKNQFVMDCAWFRFAKKWFCPANASLSEIRIFVEKSGGASLAKAPGWWRQENGPS
ncbi:hypothetical protein ACDY96_29115 [Rhizobium mongolense]|uniref:hypothetical protein n=1 Tax=Rhizobium TaxID=379 RepID=UPI0024B09B5B|nr:hypothetical protein [Rhizobium sp. CC1099]WFU87997.1 hypothetical protein QA644_02565 [Rhizobium sp. CC1099]